ncbi:hypothetical protein [Archangium violaceum]|uniref:hypothetical protein n=1 Tax=Archangium violaceum TaxID=83451 RepID=UPI0037C15A46
MSHAGVRAVPRTHQKRNALAVRYFESFTAIEKHLVEWMDEADVRVHGTSH